MNYFDANFTRKLARTISGTVLILMLSISSALGATLEEAKAAGQIGEKQDGYIGLVQNTAPADVVTLINDVNAQRRQRYEQIARENGIDVREVAKLAFTRALENTKSGHFVEASPGQWVRKP